MRVRIQGVVYETTQDAAAAFNVTEQTIRRAVCEGREDRLTVKRIDCKRGRPQPITIEGVTFPNCKAANVALGLPYNYIGQALSRQSAKSLAKVAAAARTYKEGLE
jgi:hypothetical protein